MYFYDNCFSMMFLSNFLLQPWMNRWFAENEELPTQASMISVQLIFLFLCFLSQPCKQELIQKTSIHCWSTFYILLDHNYIHCWSTFIFNVGTHFHTQSRAHIYMDLPTKVISHVIFLCTIVICPPHNLLNRFPGSMQDLVC